MPHIFHKLFFILTFFCLQSAFAKTYSGVGHWENSGGLRGAYETVVDVNADGFNSSYFDYSGENVRSIQKIGPSEKFIILVNDSFSGEGFCLNEICQLNWIEGNDILEENWIFRNNKIIRQGKRSYGNGDYVLWNDEAM